MEVIYGLVACGTGEVRYVGKTSKPVVQRKSRHIWQARGKDGECVRWVSKWIRSVDYQIHIVVLESDPDDSMVAERLWIQELQEYGCRLTNLTSGGEGAKPRGYQHSPEHRARISEANRRRFADPSARERIAEANRNRVITLETRAKMSAVKIGFKHTEEAKRKMSVAKKGKPKSAETRARMKIASQKRAELTRGVPLSEEHRAKISATTKGKPKSLETVARMREAWVVRRAVKAGDAL